MCTYPFMHDFSYTQLFSSNYVIVSECEHYRSRYASAIITIKPWASSPETCTKAEVESCVPFLSALITERNYLWKQSVCRETFATPTPTVFFLCSEDHIFFLQNIKPRFQYITQILEIVFLGHLSHYWYGLASVVVHRPSCVNIFSRSTVPILTKVGW